MHKQANNSQVIDRVATRPVDLPARTAEPPRTLITAEGERALRAELERLQTEHEAEITERLREARSFGDVENDDMLQIQEELGVLASRIGRLRTLLRTATIVDEADDADGAVAIGTSAEVLDLDSGSAATYLLTGGHEPLAAANAVSANSPVGQGLIGRTPGAVVEIELPNGRIRRLKLLAVRG